MKKILSAGLRITISFGLLGLLFWLMRDRFGKIGSALIDSDIRFIIAALISFMVCVMFLAMRLKVIFYGENIFMKYLDSVQLTYIGYFFNNFMPTAVGGDIPKALYAAQAHGAKMKSYISVMMDRIIGLYSFLILAAIALVVGRGRFNIPGITQLVFVFLTCGVIGFIVITNTKIARLVEKILSKFKVMNLGKKLHEVYTVVHDYRNRKDIVVKSILISVVAQSFYFLMVYMFLRSLGGDVGIINVFLIMPVVSFISMIPSIGGLGVREGAIVTFFAALVGKEIAFAGSLLVMLGFFYISFIGGIVFFFWSIRMGRKERV